MPSGRRLRIGVVTVLGGFALVSTTALQARRHQPTKIENLVSQVSRYQDELVGGNRKALKSYRQSVTTVSRTILRLPVSVWERKQNRTAGIKYLLSGGHAAIGQRIMEGFKVEGAEAQLLKGAIAFADGDRKVALKLLKPLDALEMPPSVAGNLALIQGILTIRSEPKAATKFFKRVLVLAPFSLQSEAALRRLVRIPMISKDWDALSHVGSRYLRRYPNSIFSESFSKPFAVALAAFKDYDSNDSRRARLLDLLRRVDADHRRPYVRTIAQVGLVIGNLGLAEVALGADSKPAAPELSRDTAVELYKAIAKLLAGESKAAVQKLQRINRNVLVAADLRLLRESSTLGQAIRARPSFSEDAEQLRKLAAEADGKEFISMKMAEKARAILASTDKLLGN